MDRFLSTRKYLMDRLILMRVRPDDLLEVPRSVTESASSRSELLEILHENGRVWRRPAVAQHVAPHLPVERPHLPIVPVFAPRTAASASSAGRALKEAMSKRITECPISTVSPDPLTVRTRPGAALDPVTDVLNATVSRSAVTATPHTPVPIEPIPDVPHTLASRGSSLAIPDTAVPVDSPPKVSDTVVPLICSADDPHTPVLVDSILDVPDDAACLDHSVALPHPAVAVDAIPDGPDTAVPTISMVPEGVSGNAPCTKVEPESIPTARWSHRPLRNSVTLSARVLCAQAALWSRVSATMPVHGLCGNAASWYRVFDRGKVWYRVFDRGKGMGAACRDYFWSFTRTISGLSPRVSTFFRAFFGCSTYTCGCTCNT